MTASYPLPNGSSGAANNGITPTGWSVWVSDNETSGLNAPTTHMTPYLICASP